MPVQGQAERRHRGADGNDIRAFLALIHWDKMIQDAAKTWGEPPRLVKHISTKVDSNKFVLEEWYISGDVG